MANNSPPSRHHHGDWLCLKGNIPSLSELCRRIILSHQELRDIVALNDGSTLPNLISHDVLEDREDWHRFGGPPAACRPGENATGCGCSSFFNPGSAVFLDDGIAVLLEGRCCLKRTVVDILGGGEVILWRPPELTPRAVVEGGGARCKQFVLRIDGAIVGISRCTLCVFPPADDGDKSIQRGLHFCTDITYSELVLPSVIRSKDTIFAAGMYSVDGGGVLCCDVLAVDVRTGLVRRAKERMAQFGYADDRHVAPPRNFMPTSLLELPNNNLIVMGSIPCCIPDERGRGIPVLCKCHMTRKEDQSSEWNVEWTCVRIFDHPSERIVHPQMSGSSIVYSDISGACMAVYVKDGTADVERCGLAYTISVDKGMTWTDARSFHQNLTNWGVTKDCPVLAFSPFGTLFSFAYEAFDCRKAEHKSLLQRFRKRGSSVRWPAMNLYQWSARL